jgi:hypothetical protein
MTAATPIALPDRPFRRADLRELGYTRSHFVRLVREGVIRAVVRDAYVRADLDDCVERRAAAVALVVADHHVAIDRTAAAIHGVSAFGFAELDGPPPIETAASPHHRATKCTGVDGQTRDLAAGDVMEIDGLRLTTPLRTALDLGRNLKRREALAAMNALARLHGITKEQLRAQVPRFKGHRGVVQLRELVELVEPRIESPRESWTWLAIHDEGLPMPEPQVWVDVDGVPTYRLDFAYVRRRIAVEYDGEEFHDRTDAQRRHDAARRGWLRENGWTVIVVRAGDFTGDALDRWIRALREALAKPYTTRRW